MAMTRVELDVLAAGGCPCCGDPYSADNPLEFTGKCHPRSEAIASYWDGVLTLKCAECGTIVTAIEVANPIAGGPPENAA